MNFIRRIFKRKQFKPQPRQLRIDGVKTTLTPTPDDAELAAQALLETLASDNGSRRNKGNKGNVSSATIPAQLLSVISFISAGHKKDSAGHKKDSAGHKKDSAGEKDAQYYRNLSEKIRAAHDQERRAAMRYVAYCESQITSAIIACHTQTFRSENHQTSDISHQPSDISHQPSDIAELERGLYKHQDAVEREGGELLKRWQKCLALVIVRETINNNREPATTDLTDGADEHQPSDI